MRWSAEDGRWTPGAEVANGLQPGGPRLPTWNPVLFAPKHAPLQLFYKVGPSPSTWWGMVITSGDAGKSWSAPRRLPSGIPGPIKWSGLTAAALPHPNSGTDALTLADGRQLIVYNHSAHRPEEAKGNRWPLDVAVSVDGMAWRHVLTLEAEPCEGGYAYPAVIQAADGKVHLTYTMNRKSLKHVVLDPGAAQPIRSGVCGIQRGGPISPNWLILLLVMVTQLLQFPYTAPDGRHRV